MTPIKPRKPMAMGGAKRAESKAFSGAFRKVI
jgi:hypothetical protein